MHLRTVDAGHPLANRATVPTRRRGRGAGSALRPVTTVQQAGLLLLEVPRLVLAALHFTPGCRTDPTEGKDKKTAAKEFKTWLKNLPETDVTVFSNGTEQYVDGNKRVAYRYAIY